MKKYFILTLLVFISKTNVISQNSLEDKDSLLNSIAIETCDCISKKNLDFETMPADKLQLEFGFCILGSYSNHKDQADLLLHVSLDDEDSMEMLGQQVALKMFNNCPDYVLALANDHQSNVDENNEDSVVTGNIVNIEKNQFNIIELKDSASRIHKLLWLEYFEGEHLLHSNTGFKNLTFKVAYYESEMFDPTIMEYRKFKINTKLSTL